MRWGLLVFILVMRDTFCTQQLPVLGPLRTPSQIAIVRTILEKGSDVITWGFTSVVAGGEADPGGVLRVAVGEACPHLPGRSSTDCNPLKSHVFYRRPPSEEQIVELGRDTGSIDLTPYNQYSTPQQVTGHLPNAVDVKGVELGRGWAPRVRWCRTGWRWVWARVWPWAWW